MREKVCLPSRVHQSLAEAGVVFAYKTGKIGSRVVRDVGSRKNVIGIDLCKRQAWPGQLQHNRGVRGWGLGASRGLLTLVAVWISEWRFDFAQRVSQRNPLRGMRAVLYESEAAALGDLDLLGGLEGLAGVDPIVLDVFR